MFRLELLSFSEIVKADKWINSKIDGLVNFFKTGNFKGIGTELINNLNQNFAVAIIVFIVVFIVLYFIFGKEKSEDALYGICKQIGLIFSEKTDQPVTKRGSALKDKAGKTIYHIIEHVPKFNFENLPSSFVISNIHTSVSKNLFQYLNGLLSLLKKNSIIEQDSGSVASTGYPGEYIVSLHNRKMLEQRAMFKEIRWYKEETINGIVREYFPEITVDDKEVIIKLPEELKINDDIIRRGLETFSRFFEIKIKTHYERSADQSMVFFKYQTALNILFKAGDSIPKKVDVWNSGIIDKMKMYYAEDRFEWGFFGELKDPNITWKDTQLFWKLPQSPHFMVIGQTRSGKTKSIVSLVCTFAQAYPKSKFRFADGKGSSDYDGFAKILSDYPVAKMSAGDDSLVELANIIFMALRDYEATKAKIEEMSQKGFPCSTYIEYNNYIDQDETLSYEEKEERKIRRYFIIIDEFAEFIRDSPDSVEKLLGIKGTIFWGIAKLLRAAASCGFTLVIASQRYQNTDFPTPIRSNLTNWMIHNINVRDAESLSGGMGDIVTKLSSGEYILRVPGMYCDDTKNQDLKCAMPFVGDDTKAMVDVLGRKQIEHNKFDYDLIYNSGKEEDFSKLSPPVLLKMIKQAFLTRENYNILFQSNPEMDYISLAFTDSDGNLYNLGIVDADEISDFTFIDKLVKQRNEYFDKSRKVFFVTGKLKEVITLTSHLRDAFGSKVNILRELDFERPLKQALEYYRVNDKTKIFHTLLNIEREKASDAAPLYESNYKDKKINVAELERIKNINGNNEKGDAFEDWYRLFEKRMGFNTVPARSLVEEGIIPNIFATTRAEGGFDLIRWVDKDEKIAIGIQLKNQISKNLDGKVIDKTLKSKLLYEDAGLTITDTLLVTTGSLTKQAYGEAQAVGVRVINGAQLEDMLNEYEEMQPNEASYKKELESYDLPLKMEEEEAPYLNDEEDDLDEHDGYTFSDEDLADFQNSLAEEDEEFTHEEKVEHQKSIQEYLATLNKNIKPKN